MQPTLLANWPHAIMLAAPPRALAKRNQDKAAKYAFKCLDISHPLYK